MKNITILGATGSIGRSTLDVIKANPDKFNVVGLSANKQVEVLKKQILFFKPDIVALADNSSYEAVKLWASGLNDHVLNGKRLEIVGGESGLATLASYDKADFVISAIVGASGLKPTLSAIRAGKDIGLANKETLVMAGELVNGEAARHNVKLLPVDSEHSAIFQCLEGREKRDISRVILTASGGPFFNNNSIDFSKVTVAEALRHPNWSMGAKVTIDSATLMNKGLEVIEAYHLFGFPPDRIDVLVHPQSIVHSMVEFCDGSILAQLSTADMKGPIAYALSYPERLDNVISKCSLEKIHTLTFHSPDTTRFPCLKYAYEALREGSTMPAVLNAANEELVNLFIKKNIKFNDIPVIIESVLQKHSKTDARNMEEIFEADRWARESVREYLRIR